MSHHAATDADDTRGSEPDIRTGFVWLISSATWREVRYRNVDGLAMFEGDIALGTADAMEERARVLRHAGEAAPTAIAVTGQRFRWPNGLIPYVIDQYLPDPARVIRAIEHWQRNTGIRFLERTASAAGSFLNWLTFRPNPTGEWNGPERLAITAKQSLALAWLPDRGGFQLFGIGPDDAVWTVWQDRPDDVWHGPERLDLQAGQSIVALPVPGGGGLQVFGIGLDDAVWTVWQDRPFDNWHGPERLDLAVKSSLAATWISGGGLQVFGIGLDDAVWTVWQDRPFDNWHGPESLGLRVKRSITALPVPGGGGLQVFGIGLDDAVWTVWQDRPFDNWHGPEQLALSAKDSIAATWIPEGGGLQVFAIGLDDAVWTVWQDRPFDNWHGPERLSLTVKQSIAVTPIPNSGLQVFGIGLDNQVLTVWQDEAFGSWRSAENVGIVAASSIVAGPLKDGVQVFGIGAGGPVDTVWKHGARGACNSPVGMQGGQQFVSLARGCGTKEVIHEIGHAAGLWHEQSREDRDRYVRILYENILDGEEHNFDQEISDGDDIGEYDFASVMHYSPYAFSKNGKPTIESLGGQPFGFATGLSGGDIAAIQSIYRFAPRFRPGGTVAMPGPEGLELFAIAEDGGICHIRQESWQAWNGWERLGLVVKRVAVVVPIPGGGGLQVFGIGLDDFVWTIWQDRPLDNWHGPERLELSAKDSIAAAWVPGGGGLQVFGIGLDDAVWTVWQDRPFDNWHGPERLELKAKQSLAAAWVPGGGLQVFAIGSDDAVWTVWQDRPFDSWHGPEQLALSAKDSIAAAVVPGGGGLQVFGIGLDDAVWTVWQDRPFDNWHGPERLALSGKTKITVEWVPEGGGLQVFAIGSDDAVWTVWQDRPFDAWHGPERLGGSGITDLATIPVLDAGLGVFTLSGDDAGTWHAQQDRPFGPWGPFSSLRAINAPFRLPAEIGVYPSGSSSFEDQAIAERQGTEILLLKEAEGSLDLRIDCYAAGLTGGDIHATGVWVFAPSGALVWHAQRIERSIQGPASVQPVLYRASGVPFRRFEVSVPTTEQGLFRVLFGTYAFPLFQRLTVDLPEAMLVKPSTGEGPRYYWGSAEGTFLNPAPTSIELQISSVPAANIPGGPIRVDDVELQLGQAPLAYTIERVRIVKLEILHAYRAVAQLTASGPVLFGADPLALAQIASRL